MSRPFRVLFLCTGNSARSQIAQALLAQLGAGRFEAASAGTVPAEGVNPGALEALAGAGVPWAGQAPRPVDGLEREDWNLVVTVCDDARESCPVFPPGPIMVHWGMPDPAIVEEGHARRRAFFETLSAIRSKITALVALPVEDLPRAELELRITEIAPQQHP